MVDSNYHRQSSRWLTFLSLLIEFSQTKLPTLLLLVSSLIWIRPSSSQLLKASARLPALTFSTIAFHFSDLSATENISRIEAIEKQSCSMIILLGGRASWCLANADCSQPNIDLCHSCKTCQSRSERQRYSLVRRSCWKGECLHTPHLPDEPSADTRW